MSKLRVLQLSVFMAALVSLTTATFIFTRTTYPAAKTTPTPTGKVVNATWITLDAEPQITWLPGAGSKAEVTVPHTNWQQYGERSSLSFHCPQVKLDHFTNPNTSSPEG